MLLDGEADLIATNLKQLLLRIPSAFPTPYLIVKAVRYWQRELQPDGQKKYNRLVRKSRDLIGKPFMWLKNSSYVDCLQQISNQLSDTIGIVEIPDYDVEQLMQLVAEGEIPYTVCSENIAQVNKGLYPNLDINCLD